MHTTFTNIPLGQTFRFPENKHAATEKIVSDGKVDEAFLGQGDGFIQDIHDARVQAYVQDETASPGDGWVAHPLGGFDRENQSLYMENGAVTLRTKIQEDGTNLEHKVQGVVEPDFSVFPGNANKMTYVAEGYMVEDTAWTARQAKAEAEGKFILPTEIVATSVADFYQDWLMPNA